MKINELKAYFKGPEESQEFKSADDVFLKSC
jgi:hypothetical protein